MKKEKIMSLTVLMALSVGFMFFTANNTYAVVNDGNDTVDITSDNGGDDLFSDDESTSKNNEENENSENKNAGDTSISTGENELNDNAKNNEENINNGNTNDGDQSDLGTDNLDSSLSQTEENRGLIYNVKQVDGYSIYKFNMPIQKAEESYAIEFDTDNIEGEYVSLDLLNIDTTLEQTKQSFSLYVENKDGDKKVYTLDNIENSTIEINKGDKVYLIYIGNPNNEAELTANNHSFVVETVLKPKQMVKISYNNAENNVVVNNVVGQYQSIETADKSQLPETVVREVENIGNGNDNIGITKTKEAKKTLTGEKTGPVENALALMLILFGLYLLFNYESKKSN